MYKLERKNKNKRMIRLKNKTQKQENITRRRKREEKNTIILRKKTKLIKLKEKISFWIAKNTIRKLRNKAHIRRENISLKIIRT